MGLESVVLRPANRTYDDGVAFARLADVASEGGYRYALGRRYTDIIATAFSSPGHDMSYEHTVFAEEAGAIIGMISGYMADRHETSSDAPLRLAAGNRAVREMRLALLRAFYRILSAHDERDFYVHFLAVDPDARGRGIGASLIELMETRAREAGALRFTLDVAARNARAARLYRRHGLAAEAVEHRNRLRSLFVHRMAKDL